MHDDKKPLPNAAAHGSLTSSKPQSSVEAFIEKLKKQQAAVRGRLIFALDATASRQPAWDAASKLTADMFQEVGTIGGLEMQLVYYRGQSECQASRWFANSTDLTNAMARIICAAGLTQIGKILSHSQKETKKLKVSALVFVGDAMEENPDTVIHEARELGRLHLPVFMFQEGNDPQVEQTFREIAQSTKGAYCRFDAGSAHELGKLLRAVAAYAAGGAKALEGRKDEASVKLLTQIRKGSP
jgi:hypothetical protein